MDDKGFSSTLEEINQRFVREREIQFKTAQKKKRKKIYCAAGAIVIALAFFSIFVCYPELLDRNSAAGAAGSAKRIAITEKYRGLLDAQEMEAWKETKVQPGKAYIQIKTEIHISEGNMADIRLANPPYCAYDCRIEIKEKETENLLYKSERLSPGTMIERAALEKETGYGETDVIVTYYFYRHGRERLIRSREITAVLRTEK